MKCLNIFDMIHLITEVFGLTDIGGRLCGRWGHLRMPFRQKANKATHELARQDHKKQMYSRSQRNKYCTGIVKKYKKQTMWQSVGRQCQKSVARLLAPSSNSLVLPNCPPPPQWPPIFCTWHKVRQSTQTNEVWVDLYPNIWISNPIEYSKDHLGLKNIVSSENPMVDVKDRSREI